MNPIASKIKELHLVLNQVDIKQIKTEEDNFIVLVLFVTDTAGKALDQLSTTIRPDKKYVTDRKDLDGSGIDIHKLVGKLPRPKAGWTPGKYKYMGAYNPLDKQLEYDPETGEVLRWHVMPFL